jgi:hypothetical protein
MPTRSMRPASPGLSFLASADGVADLTAAIRAGLTVVILLAALAAVVLF